MLTINSFTISVYMLTYVYLEIAIAHRKSKLQIKNLENELPKWQEILDTICTEGKAQFI